MKSWLLIPAALCAPLAAQELKVPAPRPVTQDVKTAPRELGPAETASAHAFEQASGPVGRESLVENARVLPSIDHNQLRTQVDEDGIVWVRGASYKASFGAGQATYIPFLGSRAPQNYPVDFRLARVSVGGQELAFDTGAAAHLVGDTVEFDRGPFVERYVLSVDSIEQTFVFAALPNAGEIVVTIGVDSVMASTSDAEGFRFANELGHVRYGRASALDQGSLRESLEAALHGDQIEIHVPATVASRASLPLVIDPVISTYTVDGDAEEEFTPDTAYDASQGSWLTVYEDHFSATDYDINATRHTSTGTVLGSLIVDISTTNYAQPRIANNNLANQFLIVATGGTSPNREIYSKTVNADGSSLSAFAQVSSAELGDKFNPDVGGDPLLFGPTYYCVVWQRNLSATDTDIHARLMTNTNTTNGGVIFLENSSGTLDSEPAISNSDGIGPASEQDWGIVWVHEQSSTNDDLQGARIHWNGTITSPTFTIASLSVNEVRPTISTVRNDVGGTRNYVVAYQLLTANGDYDIRVRAFNGTSVVGTVDLPDLFPDPGSLNQATPTVDTDGTQFVLAYREAPLFFTTTDIKVVTLYLIGSGTFGLTEGPVSVAPGLFQDLRPELYTRYSSGVTTPTSADDTVIVWDRANATQDIMATYYDMPNGGPINAYCFGLTVNCPCGNGGAAGHGCGSSVNPSGALLGFTGTASVASDTLTLLGSGMPTSGPCLYFQGTAQTNGGAGATFGDGLRCSSGTVIRLGTKTNSGGNSAYPTGSDPDIHIRGSIPAAGAVRYYQGWYRNSASFCTPSGFNLTNGLRVVWVP